MTTTPGDLPEGADLTFAHQPQSRSQWPGPGHRPVDHQADVGTARCCQHTVCLFQCSSHGLFYHDVNATRCTHLDQINMVGIGTETEDRIGLDVVKQGVIPFVESFASGLLAKFLQLLGIRIGAGNQFGVFIFDQIIEISPQMVVSHTEDGDF